jgi:isopropylmalate/homocitrate/citramalate synthase
MNIFETPDLVLISEAGPRDGLQSIDSVMSFDHKYLWIKALDETGI